MVVGTLRFDGRCLNVYNIIDKPEIIQRLPQKIRHAVRVLNNFAQWTGLDIGFPYLFI